MLLNLIIFGLIGLIGVAIGGIFYKILENKPTVRNIGLVVLVLLVFLLGFSWAVVPAGYTGVYHLFGKVADKELSSGFHLKNPLAAVTQMSIRTEEYTMSIAPQEGQKKGVDSIDALTKEGLKVIMDMTVLYHLNEESASDVYKELGTNYVEKIIRPQIRSGIRETVALYSAKDIYSDKRQEVENKIFDTLASSISPRGIVIEKVLLRNVILPEKLVNSIEEKLAAEQEAQKMDFVLEKEKKEAERKAIEAKGIKVAQETIQKTLTPEYLRWYSIEMMKGLVNSPNTTFLFVPIDQNGIPIVNLPILNR